ncbi:MAG TPA: zinc-ribbon domain-containing protein, partial [Holophaga sp.]|nr:zinc-ribbon domain-containing protein [Holophaga sp.]
MTETIRCPGCSTRFALRPERVGAGIRRAKCFKCGTVFDIAEAVERLLAAAEPAAEIPAVDPGATTPLRVHPELLAPPEALPVIPAEPVLEPEVPSFPASLLATPLPGDTVNLDVEPPPMPEVTFTSSPLEASPFEAFDAAPPSLTLGDLEGSDEEIMEKTLVILPPPEQEASQGEPGASGFTSAKDAIAKLMGDAPAPPPSPERRMLGARNPMDVEATLSALEVTLSGAQGAPAPQAPVPSASTLKLSAAEIQAAIGAAPVRLPDMPSP